MSVNLLCITVSEIFVSAFTVLGNSPLDALSVVIGMALVTSVVTVFFLIKK